MNHRQHYQTTTSRWREACKNIGLAVTLGIIGAMLIADWWLA